ncbi:polysaccharide biosynthesis protein [Gammaproteobacteria bacterium]|nr:polysaccharide biosynthesis protein [Gammaproteobacteria bacterium]
MGLKKALLEANRKTKQVIALIADFFLISISCFVAIQSSEAMDLSLVNAEFFAQVVIVPLLSAVVFSIFGIYKSIVRYINFSIIFILLKAILISFILLLLTYSLLNYLSIFSFKININNTVWLFGLMMSTIFLIGIRVFANFYFSEHITKKRVLIYGAGSAGIQLANALRVSSELEPIGFVDKSLSLQNKFLGGLRIYNPKKIEAVIAKYKIDEVLIAIPSASKSLLRGLLSDIEKYSVKVRILPGLSDLAQGNISVSELKDVDITDLIGRQQVFADKTLLNRNIKDKVVLVTGAGGSIGSEIARQVAKLQPKRLVLLDSNEYSLYLIQQELEKEFKKEKIVSALANVTNKLRLKEILQILEVETIYHTAAYKHVPLVEENPFEGVRNNIFGTKFCVEAAIESEIETFVLISTDKAVRPTNIMGATKRLSEMILQSLSKELEGISKTRMTMVRFGNVIGSSGSAIPLFQKQIKEGGPITVTDPEIIRYFMTIPEAAELVIQAGALGEGGDVFVLDMGEPVKIIEIAKKLISLSGFTLKDNNNPNGDIEIIFTGLRPGEKLFEELLIGKEVIQTQHKQIFRAKEEFLPLDELEDVLKDIDSATILNDISKLKSIFLENISGYVPETKVQDILSKDPLLK